MSLTLLTFNKIQIKVLPIQNEGCYNNNQIHPKVKDFVEYKIFGYNGFQRAEIIKELGKYQVNIQIGITLRT